MKQIKSASKKHTEVVLCAAAALTTAGEERSLSI